MKDRICIVLCNYLINCLRRLVLCLCAVAGVEILPLGCRAIPAGHFNFDPDMVEFFGGKKAHDSINKAIIYQKVVGWIQHNEAHDRNRRDGLNWSYNTYPDWAADIRVFHQKTIEKHIRDFEAMGLLCSQQFNKHEGNRIKFYGAPVKPSDGASQMLLWSEHKTLMGGALDSALTIQNPSIHKPSMDKRQSTSTSARARKPLTGGVVAAFQIPSENRELPEKKPLTVERREAGDEGDASMPASAIEETISVAEASGPIPHSAPPLSIHADIRAFWPTIEADQALFDLVQARGEAWTLAVIRYVRRERNVANPPGLARSLLAAKFMPPGFLPYPDPEDETPPPEVSTTGDEDTDVDEDTQPDAGAEAAMVVSQVSQIDAAAERTWNTAYSQLEIQLDRASFDTWLRGAVLVGFKDGTYHIAVANSYSRDMLQHRVYRDIRRVLMDIAGAPVEMMFEVRKVVPV